MKHRVCARKAVCMAMVVGVVSLPGCSWLTRPMEKPVIEDSLKVNFFQGAKVGILSLNPERRAVLYNFESKRFCAENPTEVGIDMASASRLAADLKKAGSPDVGVQVAMSAASNNYVLNRRSPGLILYQSSSYQICQMYVNQVINQADFVKLQQEALQTAERILTLETEAAKVVGVQQEIRRTAEENRLAEAAKADREFEKLKKAAVDEPKASADAKADTK